MDNAKKALKTVEILDFQCLFHYLKRKNIINLSFAKFR